METVTPSQSLKDENEKLKQQIEYLENKLHEQTIQFELEKRCRIELENENQNLKELRLEYVAKINENRYLIKEEKKLRILFNSASDAIFIHELDGKFLEVNDAAVNKLGYSHEEFKTMTTSDIDMHEFTNKSPERMNILKEKGKLKYQTIHLSKKNRFYHIELNSCIILLEDKPVVLSIARDITDRVAAENELKESEAKFRSLIDGLNDVIFRVLLPEGKYEYISPAVKNVFGYEPSDFYDNRFFLQQIIHPNYKEYYETLTESLLNGEVLTNLEFRIFDPNGREKWIVQSIKGIFRNEKLVAIEGISCDITARKAAEKALKDSQLKYKTLLNTLPQRVIYKDENLVYLTVNMSFANDLGFDPEDIVGKTDFDLFEKEFAEKYRTDDLRIMQSGKIEDIEEVYSINNIPKIVQTVKCPVFDQEGYIKGILGIFWDISERKKVETKLKRAMKELMVANEEVIVTNIQLEQQNNEIITQRDEIQRQHSVVQRQKQQLTDSIFYAQRIQKAVMPSSELLDKLFPEHFIFYLPRDIVSGDFYWIKTLNNSVIIAVADCTGHGVPGAFMSMLGITLLKEVVANQHDLHTDALLNSLRRALKNSLRQDESLRSSEDGLDIALCIIDMETGKLQYSGANMPFYLFRKNEELIVLKPDRMPIAKNKIENPFSIQEMQLQKNDQFYLFSDGIIDQLGGKNVMRYSSRRFKSFLASIQHLSMNEQLESVQQEFNEWKNTTKQIDDVIVIGIKVNGDW